MKFAVALLSLALIATPALASKKSKAVEPLAADLIGHVTVASTSVTVNEIAQKNFDKLEAKAAAKASAPAAAAPPTPDAKPDAPPPPPDRYAGMPFAQMLPLVVEEETHAWGLTTGRRVKLDVAIDSLRTGSAGMAMLIGSTDELAGTVIVTDAESGERLGEYYVDVLNSHSGLLGLALRGSGVREKLAHAFAQRVAIELSGNKHKPKATAS